MKVGDLVRIKPEVTDEKYVDMVWVVLKITKGSHPLVRIWNNQKTWTVAYEAVELISGESYDF